MKNRAELLAVMPAMFDHEGWWDGWYRHYDTAGKLLDEHRVKTCCEFPDTGPDHYFQRNWLTWADGRTAKYEFGGHVEGDRLVWESDAFAGYGWQTHENLIMLRLERRDEPNAHYCEMIEVAPDGQSRARTWQWFKDGRPWKRTLCDEQRIEGPNS